MESAFLAEECEARVLLAVGPFAAAHGHLSPQQEFAAIQRAVNHEKLVTGNRELNILCRATELSAIRNDLTILGFFQKHAGRPCAEFEQIESSLFASPDKSPKKTKGLTQQQELTQFQTDYQRDILSSAPEVAELLYDEARLAKCVAEVVAPILIEGPAGMAETMINLNENAPEIVESIRSISENPLLNTPGGSLAGPAEEVGFDEAIQDQPIILPPPPAVIGDLPSIEYGFVPPALDPNPPIITLPLTPTSPTPTPSSTPTPTPTATPLSGTFEGTYDVDGVTEAMRMVIPPGLTGQGGDVTATVTLDDEFRYFTFTIPIDLSYHSGVYSGDGDPTMIADTSFDFDFQADGSSAISGSFEGYDNSLEFQQGSFQLTLA